MVSGTHMTLNGESPDMTATDDKAAATAARSKTASASVKVDPDGSVFVQADENYLRERDNILPVIEGKRGTEAPGNQLKLSNDLLYSLD